MEISVEEKKGISIFRMTGDIDINTAPELKTSFDEMAKRSGIKVILNLKKVDYVDSSGLATMVEILKKLRDNNGSLKVTNLSAKVKGLFEITKLTQLFDIFNEEDEAVNSFG
ncbi:MAG: STAS domain-containing protein [Candidatus Omnitrophica bacterium]|nr:STAS domain-containing protein [Candidatus Omnitrophota bacterium]